jgi:hypothetical protein
MRLLRVARSVASTLALVSTTGCILSSGVQPSRLTVARAESLRVDNAVKAHLVDGTIVVFPMGMRVMRNVAIGTGWRYAPTLRDSTFVHSFPLDSVVVLETFHIEYDPGKSVLYSAILISVTYLVVLGIDSALYACCSRGGT